MSNSLPSPIGRERRPVRTYSTRSHKLSLLGTVASACLILGISSAAYAQTTGGRGGGAGGGDGGAYAEKGFPPTDPGGVDFNAGAGGDGADAIQGANVPGAGSGGYGGFGGQSDFIGNPTTFGTSTSYSGSNGQDGGGGTYTATTNNTPVDLGGGGGGAGGYGAVVSGVGSFGTTANLQGGFGGNGGRATYTTSDGYGNAYGTYTGGNGGDGGAGISIDRGETFTVDSSSGYGTVTGGNGGSGGLAYLDDSGGYGTKAIGNGGLGGVGGAGIILIGPSEASAAPSLVIVNANTTVDGGQGGAGGAGPDNGGAAGQGGAGIVIVNGGAVRNFGSIKGGQGGFGNLSEAVGQGPDETTIVGTTGAAGQGGAGILAAGAAGARASITNYGKITGGTGGGILQVTANPGDGGAGIQASQTTIVNTGTISGGAAGGRISSARRSDAVLPGSTTSEEGSGPTTGAAAASSAQGGVGIIGSDLTVTNAGVIQGGTGYNAPQQPVAIQFTGGTNRLELYATSQIVGASLAFSTADTLALGGPTNGTFDVSQIGDAGSGAAYRGFGIFQKVDGSTWTLTGTTATTTPWQIVQGTLSISSDGNLGAAAGPLTFAGGTLEITASLTSARAVILNGNGTIQTDTGVANFTGAFTDGAGTTGNLIKTGSGTLQLSGASTYSGVTTVDAGTLEIDGSITSANVVVNNGGTLAGTGKIGDPVINPGGTLAPGSAANPTGTLTIVGPLTFASGSTYQVNITPTTNSRTNVTGPTTINGGTVVIVPAPGGYNATRYTVLTSSSGVGGRFGGIMSTVPFAFLTPTLSYDANDVYVSLVPTASFQTAAQTPNQNATAGALQTLGPGNPLFGIIQVQTVPGAQQAFDATSGEGHASASTAAILDARIISTAVFDRLWNVGGATGDVYQVLQGFGQGPLPTLLRCYAPGDTVTREILSSYSVWAVGIGDFGQSGGNGNAAALERTLGGFVGGVDKAVYGAWADVWRFGIAGGYTSDDLRVGSGRGTSGTFESVFGTLYGGVRAGSVDARFGVSVAGNTTTLQRNVFIPGALNETERSRNGGMTVQGFGELGYRFAFGQKVIEPVAGFTAVSVHQDGFTEDGGIAALRGFGHDTNVQTTELGFRAEMTPFASLPVVARLHLAWQHSFGDLDPASVLAFEAGSSAFTVTGAPIDRDAALIEAGADYRATGALTVGLNYIGTIGARDYDHSVRGRVEYRF